MGFWSAGKAKDAVRGVQVLDSEADRLVEEAAAGRKPDSAAMARLEKRAEQTASALQKGVETDELVVARLARRAEDATTPLGRDTTAAQQALRRQLLAELERERH